MFVRGVAELAEAFVSVKRLQNFLEADEMHQMITNETIQQQKTTNVENEAISVVNLTANWSTGKSNDNIAYKMTPGDEDDAIEEISLRKREQSTRQHDTLNTITVNIKKGSLVGIVGIVGAGTTIEQSLSIHKISIFYSSNRKKFIPSSVIA